MSKSHDALTKALLPLPNFEAPPLAMATLIANKVTITGPFGAVTCRADQPLDLGIYLVEMLRGKPAPPAYRKTNLPQFYVTYGGGTNLSHCFSVVEGEDYGAARAIVDEITGGKFAFMYSSEEFAGQQERWGLREVPLQAQIKGNEDAHT